MENALLRVLLPTLSPFSAAEFPSTRAMKLTERRRDSGVGLGDDSRDAERGAVLEIKELGERLRRGQQGAKRSLGGRTIRRRAAPVPVSHTPERRMLGLKRFKGSQFHSRSLSLLMNSMISCASSSVSERRREMQRRNLTLALVRVSDLPLKTAGRSSRLRRKLMQLTRRERTRVRGRLNESPGRRSASSLAPEMSACGEKE